ncbi:MAG: hypothetical protein ACYCST_17385 [Acidimicrobiales bacterium]
MSAVRRSLACYPLWWRERYGAEQQELAEDLAAEGRPLWPIAASLFAGSVRARLSGSGMPPVAELWSGRTRTSVVIGTVPAALALPLEFAFLASVTERGGSGPGSIAAIALSGAGSVTQWELTALFSVWLLCAVNLLVAGSHLCAGLWALASGGGRVRAVALTAAPLAAVLVYLSMLHFSSALSPVVSGEERNLITGATHVFYARRGHPLAAAVLLWGGWFLGAAGWTVGLAALGREASRRDLPFVALRIGASNARTIALGQGVLVVGLLALEATMAFQAGGGPSGSLRYVSRLGPWTVPALVVFGCVAALSVIGATCARRASVELRALSGQPST